MLVSPSSFSGAINPHQTIIQPPPSTSSIQPSSVKNSPYTFSHQLTSKLANHEKAFGRKRPYAVNVLEEQDGFDRKQAKRLLSQYHFPRDTLKDAYEFALQIEQTGKIPHWANNYKKTDVTKTVSVSEVDNPTRSFALKLGEKIGSGEYSHVFLDAENNAFVIKQYHRDISDNESSSSSNESCTDCDDSRSQNTEFGSNSDILNKAKNETQSFQDYYGADAAQLLQDSEDNYYMRMERVVGEKLEDLPNQTLPANALVLFDEMIKKLHAAGIDHNDLHPGNIFWVEDEQCFYPIDIYNDRVDNAEPTSEMSKNKKYQNTRVFIQGKIKTSNQTLSYFTGKARLF